MSIWCFARTLTKSTGGEDRAYSDGTSSHFPSLGKSGQELKADELTLPHSITSSQDSHPQPRKCCRTHGVLLAGRLTDRHMLIPQDHQPRKRCYPQWAGLSYIKIMCQSVYECEYACVCVCKGPGQAMYLCVCMCKEVGFKVVCPCGLGSVLLEVSVVVQTLTPVPLLSAPSSVLLLCSWKTQPPSSPPHPGFLLSPLPHPGSPGVPQAASE